MSHVSLTVSCLSIIGQSRCAIVDTFWQTETGGHALTPMPGATPTKPGSAVSNALLILISIISSIIISIISYHASSRLSHSLESSLK